MRTATRYRGALYASLIGLGLVAACLWSASYLADAREAASQASRELDACRLMGERIGKFRDRPSGAGPGSLDQTDLHRRGQEALEQLGVPPDRLVQIAPEVPRSVGQSAYKEVPSQVLLRDLTLRQVVGFLLAMTGDRSALHARSLRLHAPRDGAEGTRWAVELTLSYLSYEPPPTVKLAGAAGVIERDSSR